MHQEDSLLLLGLGLIFLGLNSSNSLQNSLMSIKNGLIEKETLSSVLCKNNKATNELCENKDKKKLQLTNLLISNTIIEASWIWNCK